DFYVVQYILDNLYLDMNGIIHQCSHPNDVDAHFRVSEEKIFIGIFNYIDHLFTKIKPKKLFFMAVDGVAPRAKMNQQRSRRFRTAKDALEAIKKAQARGEELPEEEPFDSNCITPGTEFMKKLSKQLEYFINKKVTEDANWRDIQIVLSGHEVPGEGEHKIMEYIRTAKAQPDYNPNVRHCLYGLDADLIMLGLVSHDPHFALLREEVTFGPSKKKKSGRVEEQNFYLMHLSILREYLNLEFITLQDSLPFEYNLERIIDDFILLALFIGNDFLPHLPNLHIAEGALGLMFHVYKKILPDAGGYINDGGLLDMNRLEMVFNELTYFERDVFEEEYVDLKWFKGKQRATIEKMEREKKNKILVMTQKQREIYEQIKEFVDSCPQEPLHFPADFNARDRKFVHELAAELDLKAAVEYHKDDEGKHIYVDMDSEKDDESDDERNEMRAQVLAKYEKAEVVDEDDLETIEEKEKKKYDEKFFEWKKEYYMNKMQLDIENSDHIDKIIGAYIEGLQWVLHYYYNGVASWGWFYPFHYSPKISDLHDLDRFDIKFELGTPFRPFEQLMGVLPEGSKKLLPEPFQWLMVDYNSPIIDFYPKEFELDQNGKKQGWEAVVKIPFIDEKRLIAALRTRASRLTDEETARNDFGESMLFTYNSSSNTYYESPLPGVFSSIRSRCKMESYHLPTLEGLKLVKGLCEGVQLGIKAMAGFPSLETIPHTGAIALHGVNVFNSESKNETMVITLLNEYEHKKTEEIAEQKLGWPFLQEGFVSAISDDLFRYELYPWPSGEKRVTKNPHRPDVVEHWRRKADKLERDYSKRQGTITGTVNVVVHVLMLKGLRRLDDGALIKEYLSEGSEIDYAVQTTVDSVEFEDARFKEKPAISIEDEFPLHTQVFFLGSIHYGCPATVLAHKDQLIEIRILIPRSPRGYEPVFGKEIAQDFTRRVRYFPSFVVAKKLGISGLTLSKLTASLHVIGKVTEQRSNLGLNLKFEAKKQKVLGYTRKSRDSGWEYSDKAIQLLQEYKRKFPEFIQGLENMHKDEIYHAEDFYDKEIAVDKINEIKEWLKSVEVRDFERVALEAEQLDKEAIDQIELAAANLMKRKLKYKQVRIQNIPRHALLKPSHASTRLQDQKFSLGDRVVFVQDSGSVPIAAKGTIVGIERHNIDVVFDSSFMSGSTLGDRCSQYHGMTVPGSALLNLSNPQYQEIDNRANHSVRSHTNAPHGHNWQQTRGNGGRGGTYLVNGNHQNARSINIIPRPRAGQQFVPSPSYSRNNVGVTTNYNNNSIVNGGGGGGGNSYILRSNNGRGGSNAVAGGHYSKGVPQRGGRGRSGINT
ncbi:4885_t:CDS:10, partial [Ambispora gerdemannii]